MALEVMYKIIFDDLLEKIQNGQYEIGSRLPSEKELAEEYGVSRITSKKALEMLSDRGLVTRKPGKGTFVMNQAMADSIDEDSEPETREIQKNIPAIGVLFDSVGTNFGVDILLGMEYECRRRGIMMMLRLTYGSLEEENRAVKDMLQAGISGLVLMPVQNETYNPEIIRLYMSGFPIVLIDREMRGMNIPVVTTDNYQAACDLTNYLIDAGHTQIGLLSHSNFFTSTVNERFAGFRDTLLASGLQLDESMWIRNLDAALPTDDEEVLQNEEIATEQILDHFIDEHSDITAYFIMEFTLAVKVYGVLERRGISKELVFFDGYDELLLEGLTTPDYKHVIQGQYEMGATAVRTLAHVLRGEEITGRINVPYMMIGKSDAAE